ncbi:MAG: chaperonin GroEL [Chloroflexi bacterium]|nr:chaperonin GroEL [Chloroflexota bacterium]
MSDPFILQAPSGRSALIRGMVTMARLLRVTLGPAGRTVAMAPLIGQRPPEILDSAAIIARRMTGVGDPFEDMGAMLLRHLAWRVHERVGDGVATAAVLAQALVEAAERYVAAGGSPVPMRRGIERALETVLAGLRRQARKIDEPEEIAGLVAGTLRDHPALAQRIGSIVEAVGPDGSILVEDGESTETTWEYVEGVSWQGGYLSSHLLKPGETTVRMLEPRILLTTHHVERPEQLIPALEACTASGERNLLILAPDIKESALALLVLNRQHGRFDHIMAARAPHFGEQRAGMLDDLAVITGGRCFQVDRHERLEEVTIDDLGRARQAWVTYSHFGILGGRGEKAQIRARIADLKPQVRLLADDTWSRERVKERIGKLAGLAATIRVGAATPSDRDELKLRVEAAVTAARAGAIEGVVPGGGAALLACVPAVEALPLTGDEAYGAKIVARALEAPMRTIARNAGLEPSTIVAGARERGPGWTYDTVAGAWVNAWKVGLLDPLPVTSAALEAAISAATLALTSEVLIHHKQPSLSMQP